MPWINPNTPDLRAAHTGAEQSLSNIVVNISIDTIMENLWNFIIESRRRRLRKKGQLTSENQSIALQPRQPRQPSQPPQPP